ncbi:MAG TPA: GNAT family protein [Pyrinomonadaceae bacterium]|nr:GNAT family protein [Pyrinomonadaceae bacterium]
MFTLKVDDEIELVLPNTKKSAEKAYEIIKANYEHLHQWMGWANEGLTFEKVEIFYQSAMRKFAENGDEIALQINFNKEIVGGIGLHEINHQAKCAESGYWLAKDFNGKGIVTRSLAGLLDYAFGTLELNRIVVKCAPENYKSRAIPEKLGFTQEGIEREAEWLHTRFVDHVVYSMLAREWRKLSEK